MLLHHRHAHTRFFHEENPSPDLLVRDSHPSVNYVVYGEVADSKSFRYGTPYQTGNDVQLRSATPFLKAQIVTYDGAQASDGDLIPVFSTTGMVRIRGTAFRPEMN